MQTDSRKLSSPGISILIVDDIELNLKVLSGLLRKLALVADLASSGDQALIKVQEKRYDFIFMDIQMPGMDGIEATRQIRQLESKVGHPHIVAVTAHGSAQDKERCLGAGMNDYMEKPVLLERLCLVLGVQAPSAGSRRLSVSNPSNCVPDNAINWSRLEDLATQLGPKTLCLIMRAALMDLPSRHSDLERALGARNLELALKISHLQRGALGNLGVTLFVQVLQQIEDAVREFRWEDASRSFAQLQTNYTSITNQLNDYLTQVDKELR